MKKIRKHIAGIIILSLVMVMGTKTFTAETKKNGNPAVGAGSITSNVKSDKTKVTIRYNDDVIATGLKKMGAILGNFVEVGCNSVLNPGTIIGSNTNVYPLSMVRGYIPKGSIYKRQGEIVEKSI